MINLSRGSPTGRRNTENKHSVTTLALNTQYPCLHVLFIYLTKLQKRLQKAGHHDKTCMLASLAYTQLQDTLGNAITRTTERHMTILVTGPMRRARTRGEKDGTERDLNVCMC